MSLFPIARLPVLALVLLASCSQPNAPQATEPIAAPTASPVASPTASPTASPIVTPSPAAPRTSAPQNASSPAPTSAPSTQPAIAPQPSDAVQPTYRAQTRLAGFSADGRHFIYLESSRDTGAGIPKSTIQVVNVATSACAENGCITTRYGEPDSSMKLADAEDDLLKQTWKVRQDLKLTPPIAGTPLPIVARSRTADGTEAVTVRLNDRDLTLRLQQKRQVSSLYGGTAAQDKAAMQLQIGYNGQQRSLDSLSHFREWVLEYSIREVSLSPDGKRVAVLLTMTRPTFEGTLGTTLIQGFEL